MIRYYSKEHEDLSYAAYQIFKDYLFGTGIKSFYQECNKLRWDKLVTIETTKLCSYILIILVADPGRGVLVF